MTPMIDVVFQLLIYFVLTFEIPDRLSQMNLFRPAPDSKPPPTPQEFDGVTVTIYQDGAFAVDDARMSLDRMQQIFNRAADLDPNQPIIVQVSGNAYHRDMVKVLNMLKIAGMNVISVLSVE